MAMSLLIKILAIIQYQYTVTININPWTYHTICCTHIYFTAPNTVLFLVIQMVVHARQQGRRRRERVDAPWEADFLLCIKILADPIKREQIKVLWIKIEWWDFVHLWHHILILNLDPLSSLEFFFWWYIADIFWIWLEFLPIRLVRFLTERRQW